MKVSQRISELQAQTVGLKLGWMELSYLIYVHCLMMLNVCTKFHENISKGFRVIEPMRFVYCNLLRGITLKKCRWSYGTCPVTLSENALYLYQVLPKYLRVSELRT